MAQTIHGHEVIHLVRDAASGLTREELISEVTRRFGAETRFHTCSAGGMSLDELLQFLMVRGKVVQHTGRLHAVMAEVCSDGQ